MLYNIMLRTLKRFEQGIMVGVATTVSFSILGYIWDDQTRCKQNTLVKNYDEKILNYENEINNLKGIVSELEKNKKK